MEREVQAFAKCIRRQARTQADLNEPNWRNRVRSRCRRRRTKRVIAARMGSYVRMSLKRFRNTLLIEFIAIHESETGGVCIVWFQIEM